MWEQPALSILINIAAKVKHGGGRIIHVGRSILPQKHYNTQKSNDTGPDLESGPEAKAWSVALVESLLGWLEALITAKDTLSNI